MTECIEANWDSYEPSPVAKGRVPIPFNNSGYIKPFLKFHTVSPRSLDSALVRELFGHVKNLRSPDEVITSTMIISNGNIKASTIIETHAYRTLIQEIDEYCSVIIRYISATNWKDTFAFLKSKLGIFQRTHDDNEYIPYIDYLGCLYLNEASLITVFKELWDFTTRVRNPLHHALVFNFFSVSMEYWVQSRPNELYRGTLEGSSLFRETNALFDYMYNSTENINSPYQFVLHRFFSLLVCFSPSSFLSFMSSSGIKRFTTNAKKMKFLSLLKSQIFIKKPGDLQLTCMANIGMIAASLFKYDPGTPIAKFFLSLKSDLISAFKAYKNDFSINIVLLYSSIFCSYTLMIPDFVSDYIQKELNRPETDPFEICCLCTALRSIGAIPSAFSLYTRYMNENATELRGLIKKHTRLLLKSRAGGSSSKRSLSTSNSEVVSLPILINVFYAFNPNPYSYFEGYAKPGAVVRSLENTDMDPICVCLVDSDNDVAKGVLDYITSFVQKMESVKPEDVNFETSNPIMPIYTAGGYFAKALSDKILEIDMYDQRLQRILNALLLCFSTRAYVAEHYDLKKKCYNEITRLEEASTRQKIYSSFETAFLYCLCSPDQEVYKLASKALSAALKDGHLTSGIDKSLCPLLFNAEQYEELCPKTFVITGATALQKRKQSVVIKFTIPTDGIFNAWEHIFNCFNAGSDTFAYQNEFSKEKRNYAGMLSSLSECILSSDPDTNDRIADLIPVIEEYLKNVVKLLNSPNIYINNAIKDILSKEFSFYSLPLMFSLIETLTKEVLQKGTKEEIIRVSDGVISIIKATIQRCTKEKMKMTTISVSVLYRIVIHLSNLPNDIIYTKLKIRACMVIQDLCINAEELQMKESGKIKFNAVSIMLRWFEKSIFYNSDENSLTTSTTFTSISSRFEKRVGEMDYLLADLAMESIKGIAYLSSRTVIEVPRTSSEEDYLQAKSSKYGEMFAVLLRGLEKYENFSPELTNGSSSFIARSVLTHTNSSDGTNISETINRGPQYQRSGTMSKFIIMALTNFLTSNPDVGLKFSIPVGYHNNPKIRADFLRVFAGIIQLGVSKRLGGNDQVKYQALMEFLLENPAICIRICDICPAGEVDELATGLLNLYEKKGKGLELLMGMVTREIQNTTRVVSLLRRNSVATRMLSLFAKTHGKKYLTSTLRPLLESFVNNPEEYVFELSTDKIGSHEEKSTENVNRFMKVLSLFATAFRSSYKTMPHVFKEICRTIYEAVLPRYPEAAVTSVGSFLFLRFFCPAIVAPESEGLISEEPKREVRRSLLLLAKVIQNMANGTIYSLKLPLLYDRMGELNKVNEIIVNFMRESTMFDKSFLEIIPESTTNHMQPAAVVVEKKDMMSIHAYIYNHLDDINAIAKEYDLNPRSSLHRPSLDTFSINTTSTGSSSLDLDTNSSYNTTLYEKMQELVESIGQPKISASSQMDQDDIFVGDFGENERRLNDFMTKNSAKDFGPMLDKKLISEGVASDGTLYLIVSWGLFDSRVLTDTDMLVYRIFKVLHKMKNRTFSILLDSSGFTQKNSLSGDVVEKFRNLCPQSLLEKCQGIYCYNISSVYLPILKAIIEENQTGFVFNPNKTQYYFRSSFHDNEDFRSKPFGLSKKTRKIDNDNGAKFDDVLLFEYDTKQFVPVEISVGREYLKIYHSEPVSIQCGRHKEYLKLHDVYHATDITGSFLSSKVGVSDEFSVRLEIGDDIILSSPRGAEIIRSINSSLKKFSEHSSTASLNDIVVHSIQEISSIFNNLVFASFCSEDNDVRSAGFTLNCVMENIFGESSNSTIPRDELFVPKNIVSTVRRYSEELSNKSPNTTYDFIKGFFQAFEMTTSSRRDLILMYVSPWIHNIYTNVYLSDKRKGPRRSRTLIREFLRISSISKSLTGLFHKYIWRPLCEREELSDILVDEVINSAIDKKNEGSNEEDILSVLTAFPSYIHSQEIMNKLINISCVPTEEKNQAKALVYTQTSWVETIVLLKAITILGFDRVDICRLIVPKLIYVGAMFIGRGPLDLKSSLLKTIVNMFHIFIADESINRSKRDRLTSLAEKFTSQRALLLMGLNGKNDKEEEERMHTPSLINSLEIYIDYFYEIMDLTSKDKGQFEEWKEELLSLVIDSAFREQSAVRSRAILVMGFLAKSNTNDLISRTLTLLQSATHTDVASDERVVDLSVCLLECVANLLGGLPSDSHWYGKLFWLGFGCLQFQHPRIYTSSIQLVAKVLELMDNHGFFPDGEMIKVLMKERFPYGQLLDKLDELANVRFSQNMFDNYMRANMLRGLFYHPTRSITLKCLSKIMVIEKKNMKVYYRTHPVVEPNEELHPSLILDYLNVFTIERKEAIKFSKMYDKNMEIVDCGEGIYTPKVLLDFYSGGGDFIIVSGYFELEMYKYLSNDDPILLIFLRWLLKSPNMPQKFIVLGYLEDKFKEIMEKSTSFPILSSLQQCIVQITTDPEYNSDYHPLYKQKVLDVAEKYGFSHVDVDVFTNPEKISVNVVSEQTDYLKRLLGRILDNKTLYP